MLDIESLDNLIKLEYEEMLNNTINAFTRDLATIRSGRVSDQALNKVKVNNYGALVPINQVANINVIDTKTLSVKVWDKNILALVEKSIHEHDLGFKISSDDSTLMLRAVEMTAEGRDKMVKLASSYAEDSKVAVRNVRRKCLSDLKKIAKDENLSEDIVDKATKKIQQMTDSSIAKIDAQLDIKTKELLTL